ncbi:MAG: phosphatidate cytidylyltransferase, partial [Bacteroidales bacterium]
MNNVIIRCITGVFFTAVVVLCIWYNPTTLWILSAVITAVSLYEFYRIIFKRTFTLLQYIIHITASVYLTTILWLASTGIIAATENMALAAIPYILYLIVVFIAELYNRKEEPFTDAAKTFIGHIYIAIPTGLLSYMAFYPHTTILSYYLPFMLLAFFALIWVYDTGAFITGMLFGKHRLFERISPKKSWEGLWGGIILALLTSWGISILFDHIGINPLTIWQWIGFAITVTVAATFGDLSESL